MSRQPFRSLLGGESPSPGRGRVPCFRPTLEVLEARTAPAVYRVTTDADGGAGSLRDAAAPAQDGDTILITPRFAASDTPIANCRFASSIARSRFSGLLARSAARRRIWRIRGSALGNPDANTCASLSGKNGEAVADRIGITAFNTKRPTRTRRVTSRKSDPSIYHRWPRRPVFLILWAALRVQRRVRTGAELQWRPKERELSAISLHARAVGEA